MFKLFKRLALATAVLAAVFGLAGPATAVPTASNDGASAQAVVPHNVFRAWTSDEYEVGGATFTDQNAPACQSFGLPAGTEMHSAALIGNTYTVVLYNSATCDEGTEVATLDAAHPADSGFIVNDPTAAEQETLLGAQGALSYRTTAGSGM